MERKPRASKVEVIEAIKEDEQEEDLESSSERVKEELVALFEDVEFAESVLKLLETAESSGSSQVIQEPRVIEDKDHRKRIHMYFKCHFGGRLVTDVVAPQNHFRVSLKKGGSGRPSSYDHRNNQGPDDPKPVPFLEFVSTKYPRFPRSVISIS